MTLNGEAKNILVVTQNFFPTEKKDYKIKENLEKLANQGNKITVLGCKKQSDIVDEIQNLQYSFIEQEEFAGGSEWAYALHNIIFMWKAIKIGSSIKDNFDMIVAIVPTGFAAIAAKVIAGKKQAKYFVDIKENWVESALEAKYLTKGSPFHKAATIVEDWLLKNSEKIDLF